MSLHQVRGKNVAFERTRLRRAWLPSRKRRAQTGAERRCRATPLNFTAINRRSATTRGSPIGNARARTEEILTALFSACLATAILMLPIIGLGGVLGRNRVRIAGQPVLI